MQGFIWLAHISQQCGENTFCRIKHKAREQCKGDVLSIRQPKHWGPATQRFVDKMHS